MNNKEFIIVGGELYHYGVPGMRWGRKKGRTVHEDYKRAHSNKKIYEMSDDELKKTNNRLTEESKYKNFKKNASVGKKAVKAFIVGAATITAVAGAASTYKKYGGPIMKKIGKVAVSTLTNATVKTGGAWQ